MLKMKTYSFHLVIFLNLAFVPSYASEKKESELLLNSLNKAYNSEKFCHDTKVTISFLNEAEKIKGNAELEEYFSEKVEKLALKNPKCLIKTFSHLSSISKKKVQSFLKNPLFENKDEISKSLSKFKQSQELLN